MKEIGNNSEEVMNMSVINFALTLMIAETFLGIPRIPELDIATAIALANAQQISKTPIVDTVRQTWKDIRERLTSK